MKQFSTLTEIHQEMIQLLETAWAQQPTEDKPWVLQFADQAKAISMRQRLYGARKKLIGENYPGSANFNKLEFSTKRGDGTMHIYIPNWLKVVKGALRDKGVELKTIDELMPTVVPGSEPHHMDDTLGKLFKSKGGDSSGNP